MIILEKDALVMINADGAGPGEYSQQGEEAAGPIIFPIL
jgi:hypothetical protein